ncbi:MAG: type II secretion system F family protein [Candidatus Binatia bacterium]
MTQPASIALLISGAVITLFYGIYALRTDSSRKEVMNARLKGKSAESLTTQSAGKAKKQTISVVRETKYSDIPFLNALLGGAAFAGLLRLWLLQARVKTSPGTIVLTAALLASLGFVAAYLPTKSLLGGGLGMIFLGGLPLMLIHKRRAKRFRMFSQQLPDSLQMMKNSLQAGHTLDKAMQVISEEMPDPIALEFRETVEELHLGVPVKRAMENFTNRIIDENLKIFVAALLVQREVGGNLTELLGNLAKTIRERFRMEQEVMALTAEGRFSGYIIGALPVALAIIINVMQPDYLRPLFETEDGHNLLKAAVGMELTGFFFIRRACRINF